MSHRTYATSRGLLRCCHVQQEILRIKAAIAGKYLPTFAVFTYTRLIAQQDQKFTQLLEIEQRSREQGQQILHQQINQLINNSMAELADETLNAVFNLQRRFLKHIDRATAIEAAIFERFGETEETIPELEQLQNVRERATSSYSRVHVLLLRIAEAQPAATYATLDLLARAIEDAQATDAAIDASLQDTKRNWKLP